VSLKRELNGRWVGQTHKNLADKPEAPEPLVPPPSVGAVHVVLDNTIPGGFRMEPV
jgi:hypothetical protein